jgi:two-component system invasion response regulator UvrY
MIRILLADDLGMVLMLLTGLCEGQADFDVVGAVETGEAAMELALLTQPDVAVLDIKLPGISGLEVTRRLARRLPDTKVVVLTALDSYGFAARAMAAGAKAFLTKQAVVWGLVNAIRTVHAGGNYLDSEMAQRMALAHIREEGSPIDELSDREIDVLLLMLRGHTMAEISETLALAAKTVEHHRRSIRQKLNVTTDAQLGVVAARYGLDPLSEGS